ncbi:hypothetical protein [Martelella sp. AD-3]|uniref:hypothetical protein n=1 Tax=Martelella sp. AD-3 TaxID=686597 RepID=UPI0004678583|nr:hypothetical protein [Martelella sp. AD-3]AMM83657.1 hypothetical protein AZF01_04210 [Martelella sp. AD-3]MAM10874.1 hypothetical protein [Rhizobiaceae bacterium]
MSFYWPESFIGQIALFMAVVILIWGLVVALAPLKLMGLAGFSGLKEESGQSIHIRSMIGGTYAAMSLMALLFDQPMIYRTFGLALIFGFLTRLLWMGTTGSRSIKGGIFLVCQAVAGVFMLLYGLGWA